MVRDAADEREGGPEGGGHPLRQEEVAPPLLARAADIERVPIAFGPVPSRRLGRSLGINHIPPKTCSYACVYCQLGRTPALQATRTRFYPPEAILHDVKQKVEETRRQSERIDYLTFVPDGEPTLDINLGKAIEFLRPLGIKIAVITNASLIARDDVQDALGEADWVSVKVDALHERLWRRVNRPHRTLRLDAVLAGLSSFAKGYRGTLATETMLVRGLNDDRESIEALATVIGRLRPATAYLSVPTRPSAEGWVRAPTETPLNQAYQIFREQAEHVETLIGYEGNAFASTGDVAEDLLAITSVHPMREEAVDELLARSGASGSIVQGLIAQGHLVKLRYGGRTFLARRLPGRHAT
jgi:wyosine [tRNA(Phe)-imidazoG37] synthetase (radical SAM superfamily)